MDRYLGKQMIIMQLDTEIGRADLAKMLESAKVDRQKTRQIDRWILCRLVDIMYPRRYSLVRYIIKV